MKYKLSVCLPLIFCMGSVHANALDDLSVGGDLTLDWSVVDGGLESGETTRGLANIWAEYDVSQFLSDGVVYAGYAMYRGRPGWELAGDSQASGNIDNDDDFSRWYEVYLSFSPWNSGTLKLGQLDANSDFGLPEFGQEFVNSSMGLSPTVFAMPTYPRPVYGAVVSHQFNPKLLWKAGVYDGTAKQDSFDETFIINQVEWQASEQLKAGLGLWRHSGYSTDSIRQSSSDWYLILEGKVNETWSWFSQWGNADARFAEIERHLGAGVQCDSCLVESHLIGVAISQAKIAASQSEMAYEAFYAIPFHPNWQVKLDLQYIDKPSGDSSIDNASVFTLRLEGEI